jgi:hypothetical protein
VVTNSQDNQTVAALPYTIKKNKLGIRTITPPPLTQISGPWLSYPEGQKIHTQRSFEKKQITELVTQLPQKNRTRFTLPYNIKNWLPFSWLGFSSALRYTYVLTNIQDTTAIWDGMKGNIRREIQKAEKILTVTETSDIDDLFVLNKKTFHRQNKELPYEKKLLERIYTSAKKHNAARMFIAKDTSGTAHAAVMIINDDQMAYYLIGGADPTKRNSGAKSLLLWHAIKDAAERDIPTFNFEGSMIKPIERFFSSFGAVQLPYIVVYKNSLTHPIFRRIKKVLVAWGFITYY